MTLIYSLFLSFLVIYPRTIFFASHQFLYPLAFLVFFILSAIFFYHYTVKIPPYLFALCLILFAFNILHQFNCMSCKIDFIDLFLFPSHLFLSYLFASLCSISRHFFSRFSTVFLTLCLISSLSIVSSLAGLGGFEVLDTFNSSYSTSTGVFIDRHVGIFGEPGGASAIFSLGLIISVIYRKFFISLYLLFCSLLTLSLGGFLSSLLIVSIPFYFFVYYSFSTLKLHLKYFLLGVISSSTILFSLTYFLSDNLYLLFVRVFSGAFGNVRTYSPVIAINHSLSSFSSIFFGSGLSSLPYVLLDNGILGFNTSSYSYFTDLIFAYGFPMTAILLVSIFYTLKYFLGCLPTFFSLCFISCILLSSLAGWSYSTFYPYLFMYFIYFRFADLRRAYLSSR